ncbi:hypothetical protein EES47_16900 [Streptomyces sp. ADI98-12]|uniref:hypothetical protein n=1 Tax=Streptomyces TaxID=1883 RepID=UPI000F552BA8|nr:hypothetical protein [Streptomyces sp. ADI98-12]RPK87532.1 hypothetical protein EES47_16900 [Streptomyces sp. ADI98-12]
MAAESGKWIDQHTARTGHEDLVPDRAHLVDRPGDGPAPGPGPDRRLGHDRGVAAAGTGGARRDEPGLTRDPVAPVDPVAPGTPPSPPPPAAVPPPAPDAAAPGTGQATVKPQPPAGKNTAAPAAGGRAAPRAPRGDGTPNVPVFGAGEGERWSGRLSQAVSGFVDRPREAVAEADEVFAELAGRVTEALAEQRRVLRSGWEEPAAELDTERLRVALQSYREASERLLKL